MSAATYRNVPSPQRSISSLLKSDIESVVPGPGSPARLRGDVGGGGGGGRAKTQVASPGQGAALVI